MLPPIAHDCRTLAAQATEGADPRRQHSNVEDASVKAWWISISAIAGVPRFCPVSKWNDYYPWPPPRGLRHITLHWQPTDQLICCDAPKSADIPRLGEMMWFLRAVFVCNATSEKFTSFNFFIDIKMLFVLCLPYKTSVAMR